MATAYSWEDLEEPSALPVEHIRPEEEREANLPSTGPSTADAAEALGAGPELVALLRLRDGLERQLRSLATGAGEAGDERDRKRFPVKVHTKQTRMEERRLRLRDEEQARLRRQRMARLEQARKDADTALALKKKQLEQQACERERELAEQEARRRGLEQVVLLEHHASALELAREVERRRALETLEVSRANEARRRDREAQRARQESERQRLLARWDEERQLARARTRTVRQRESSEAQRASELRRRAVEDRIREERRSERELQLRTDERRERERRLGAVAAREERVRARDFEGARDDVRQRRKTRE